MSTISGMPKPLRLGERGHGFEVAHAPGRIAPPEVEIEGLVAGRGMPAAAAIGAIEIEQCRPSAGRGRRRRPVRPLPPTARCGSCCSRARRRRARRGQRSPAASSARAGRTLPRASVCTQSSMLARRLGARDRSAGRRGRAGRRRNGRCARRCRSRSRAPGPRAGRRGLQHVEDGLTVAGRRRCLAFHRARPGWPARSAPGWPVRRSPSRRAAPARRGWRWRWRGRPRWRRPRRSPSRPADWSCSGVPLKPRSNDGRSSARGRA